MLVKNKRSARATRYWTCLHTRHHAVRMQMDAQQWDWDDLKGNKELGGNNLILLLTEQLIWGSGAGAPHFQPRPHVWNPSCTAQKSFSKKSPSQSSSSISASSSSSSSSKAAASKERSMATAEITMKLGWGCCFRLLHPSCPKCIMHKMLHSHRYHLAVLPSPSAWSWAPWQLPGGKSRGAVGF